jgi:transcriptional regulator with XRE-family HTH domain
MTAMSLLDEARALHILPSPSERKAIREAAGLSRRRIAQELGVDPGTFGRWEAGEYLPRDRATIFRYAEILEALRREFAAVPA